jgi:hypothetical protein
VRRVTTHKAPRLSTSMREAEDFGAHCWEGAKRRPVLPSWRERFERSERVCPSDQREIELSARAALQGQQWSGGSFSLSLSLSLLRSCFDIEGSQSPARVRQSVEHELNRITVTALRHNHELCVLSSEKEFTRAKTSLSLSFVDPESSMTPGSF